MPTHRVKGRSVLIVLCVKCADGDDARFMDTRLHVWVAVFQALIRKVPLTGVFFARLTQCQARSKLNAHRSHSYGLTEAQLTRPRQAVVDLLDGAAHVLALVRARV